MPRQKLTKPTQAASASQLDRWQLLVVTIMGHVEEDNYAGAMQGLRQLRASMRKAERR